jgi:hypothetical protein
MILSRREKISAVDTAWLRMDRPGNPMMISGVLILREPVKLARLQATIEERFLRFKRFRQRPVQATGIWYWETAPAFDLDAHVAHITLPGNAGTKGLQTLMSRLASTPLDPARPSNFTVENYVGGRR